MRKWMIIVLALASSGKVSGQQARGASSEAQARDLSNMSRIFAAMHSFEIQARGSNLRSLAEGQNTNL